MLAKTEGAGRIHLPCGLNGEIVRGWDLETIGELTAEYRRQMPSIGGYSRYAWFKKPGMPNHRLDTAVYCLGALAMSRLRIDDCALQRTEARELAARQTQKTKESTAPGKWGVQPGSGVDPFGPEPFGIVKPAQKTKSIWGAQSQSGATDVWLVP